MPKYGLVSKSQIPQTNRAPSGPTPAPNQRDSRHCTAKQLQAIIWANETKTITLRVVPFIQSGVDFYVVFWNLDRSISVTLDEPNIPSSRKEGTKIRDCSHAPSMYFT